ncbi:MAG: hypothetical protein LBP61_01020 [Desulfovibrio sp.]|jgi:4-coumarate--CoA ligase (photoactive yellow protein activation family)|nr:hypothetical protein [Desulfovibrio sp.]
MPDFWNTDSVACILNSMFSNGKRTFPPGSAEAEDAFVRLRHKLALDATRFFGLEPAALEALQGMGSLEEQAGEILRRLRRQSSQAVHFTTSGSTGVPCPCRHSFIELEEEVRSLAPFFAGRRRIISVMPVHHSFGFVFALLLPRALGLPPSLHLPPLPSAKFFRTLRQGDLVLAFPVFWQSFLSMCSGNFALSCPPDLQGVTSAAPCPPEVIEALCSPPPGRALLEGMTEIFGSSEGGAIGIRRQCRGWYSLLPHWRREPAASAGGESCLPEESEWGIRRKSGFFLRLSDEVAWEDERRFVPLRRRDYAVQVGGINVFPLRIADLLRTHPKVADCAVRLMRPDEGARLKAFVVPAAGLVPDAALSRELKIWIAGKLEPASRPKALRFGESLPRTPSGKACDWDM